MVLSSALALADSAAATAKAFGVAVVKAWASLVLNDAVQREKLTSLNRPAYPFRKAVRTDAFNTREQHLKAFVADLVNIFQFSCS